MFNGHLCFSTLEIVFVDICDYRQTDEWMDKLTVCTVGAIRKPIWCLFSQQCIIRPNVVS